MEQGLGEMIGSDPKDSDGQFRVAWAEVHVTLAHDCMCLRYCHHSLDLISTFPLAKSSASVKSELSTLLKIATLRDVDASEVVRIAGVKSLDSIARDGALNPRLSLIRPLILVSR